MPALVTGTFVPHHVLSGPAHWPGGLHHEEGSLVFLLSGFCSEAQHLPALIEERSARVL